MEKIMIIGAGPAGSVAGRLFAEKGHEVIIYDSGNRPDLIVGESQIPAIMPLLKKLGVLEEVMEAAVPKPGASLYFPDGFCWKLSFDNSAGGEFKGSFNIERPSFDRIMREMALKVGCQIKEKKIDNLETQGQKIKSIDGESADFYIDATGRNRLFARKMKIPSSSGSRKDIALFAHYNSAYLPDGGNIHLDIGEDAWAWRIPLQNKVSIGVVGSENFMKAYGATDQERHDRICRENELLAGNIPAQAERISSVARYSNYQLVSDQIRGENWAMVGDSAGFIDPVFSGGLYLAVWAAMQLAERDLESYQQLYRQHLMNWQKLVESFYDKSFLRMTRFAVKLEGSRYNLARDREIVAAMVSGNGILDPEVNQEFYEILDRCRIGK